jgi:hypothetical protein
MTVKKLIEILSEFDPNDVVLVPNPEHPRHGGAGIGDVIQLKGGSVKLCLATSKGEEVGGAV